MVTESETLEIEELQQQLLPTRRPTVQAVEDILYKPIPVLDHGFVRVVDYMGDDAAIVQAARVSYGRGTKRTSEDSGLIAYLMRHAHTTPFEMCEIKFHVKLPIFVARQWIRHRTANVNEYSARYSILDREFYVPQYEVLAAQSSSNRQGRGQTVSETDAGEITRLLIRDAQNAFDSYHWLLNEDDEGKAIDPNRPGLARELARLNLPLSAYTQWYWKIDLHNLFNFLKLRSDEHAQHEIREYANVMLRIVEAWVPMAFKAFTEYRRDAANLSASALDVVKRLLNGEVVTRETSNLSPREWRELNAVLGRS